MAIDPPFIAAVLDAVGAVSARTHSDVAQHLRSLFPGQRITVCGEDEIPARLSPVATNAVGEIYFIAGGEHCLSLTNDAHAAIGIVVALRDEDT